MWFTKIMKFLPRFMTTVTPLSKSIALVVVVCLPFLGFYVGIKYQQSTQLVIVPARSIMVSPLSVKSSFTITSPSTNDTVKEGQLIDIKWSASGVNKVSLTLLQGGKDHGIIALNVPASVEHYVWKVPNNLVEQWGYHNYFIGITSSDPSEMMSKSGPFNITNSNTF